MSFYCSLLSLYFKNRHSQFLLKRIVRNSSDKTGKASEILRSTKKKKLVSVKKSVTADKQHISGMEWKTASSIIKRLNWENNNLFGPVQSSQPTTYGCKKIEESNQIIQHSTQIPIMEPIIAQSNISEKSNQRKDSPNLRPILTFPLINKSISPHNSLREQINELNTLRKYIETLFDSSVPSVSHILEKTMPSERVENLNRWKQKMINELGEEGFQKYQKDLLDNGSSLHNYINSFLISTPEAELRIKKENIGHWKSLKQVFPYIKDIKLLEEFVTHPFLCYKGVVDCFAKYKNHLVVIDWKTSKKAKLNLKSTFDNPLQIAAYVGALNFDPKYQYLASKGLIVIAYEDGMPATVHFMNEITMKQYWDEWLQRVKQYWEMKRSENEKP